MANIFTKLANRFKKNEDKVSDNKNETPAESYNEDPTKKLYDVVKEFVLSDELVKAGFRPSYIQRKLYEAGHQVSYKDVESFLEDMKKEGLIESNDKVGYVLAGPVSNTQEPAQPIKKPEQQKDAEQEQQTNATEGKPETNVELLYDVVKKTVLSNDGVKMGFNFASSYIQGIVHDAGYKVSLEDVEKFLKDMKKEGLIRSNDKGGYVLAKPQETAQQKDEADKLYEEVKKWVLKNDDFIIEDSIEANFGITSEDAKKIAQRMADEKLLMVWIAPNGTIWYYNPKGKTQEQIEELYNKAKKKMASRKPGTEVYRDDVAKDCKISYSMASVFGDRMMFEGILNDDYIVTEKAKEIVFGTTEPEKETKKIDKFKEGVANIGAKIKEHKKAAIITGALLLAAALAIGTVKLIPSNKDKSEKDDEKAKTEVVAEVTTPTDTLVVVPVVTPEEQAQQEEQQRKEEIKKKNEQKLKEAGADKHESMIRPGDFEKYGIVDDSPELGEIIEISHSINNGR